MTFQVATAEIVTTSTTMNFFIYFAVLLISATCNGQYTSQDERSPLCKSRNMYLNTDGSCDSYIECRDYKMTEMECPDGLNFDPSAQWPAYPCSFPQDVPCAQGRSSRPANPTDECSRQYGYFKSPLAHENDCGYYRICNGGKAFDMYCSAGLAFNPDTARCDWPELVPNCNVQNYVGFKCPPPTADQAGNPIFTNHKYDEDCYHFYSCVNGQARILSCDDGLAFNAITGRCEDVDSVQCGGRSVARA